MSNITMTSTDPGEGSPLAEDEYIAVYGGTKALDLFYPVGSYYKTANTSFDPNVAWGGSWQSVQLPYDDNEVVSRFVFDELQTAEKNPDAFTVKTKLGTVLHIGYTNHGTGYFISGGAELIKRVRETYDVHMTTATTGAWGLIALGSTGCDNYFQGLNNNSAKNEHTYYTTTYDSVLQCYYGDLIANSGNKSWTTLTAEWNQEPGASNTKWHGFGHGQSMGSANAGAFELETFATSNGHVPAFFQRGISSTGDYVRVVFEVYEKASTKDYALWKRTA